MNNPHQDCYFLDPELALQTAQQQNRVPQTIAVSGLQICYLGTDQPVSDPPPNLIHVPPRETLGFLTNTRLRLPKKIVLSPTLPPQIANRQLHSFNQMLRTVAQKRLELTRIYAEQLLRQCPVFEPGEPLRVFIPASRLTTVMQYASRDLANAFRALGHEVLFMIETNDMEEFEPHIVLQEQFRFKPHLVVNINHRANGWLHPEVFNLCWWQDPMPELRAAKPLAWRERDLIYSYNKDLDELLFRTGVPHVRRQGFCVDRSIFRPVQNRPRETKIVFIGSGVPASQLQKDAAEQQAFEEISARLEQGEKITPALCHEIALAHQIDPHFAYWKLFYFAVRRNTVRWLCRQKHIPVEIYGRYWEDDEIVAPLYRGEVPHGEGIAEIYRSAKYAFVCHPFEVQSQRLIEAAACGAIPVVFDCRHIAEQPHWDEHCLFFASPAELDEALKLAPPKSPEVMAEHYDYRIFVQNICDTIWQQVAGKC